MCVKEKKHYSYSQLVTESVPRHDDARWPSRVADLEQLVNPCCSHDASHDGHMKNTHSYTQEEYI